MKCIGSVHPMDRNCTRVDKKKKGEKLNAPFGVGADVCTLGQYHKSEKGNPCQGQTEQQ